MNLSPTQKKIRTLQRWLKDIEEGIKWNEKELAGAKKNLEENLIRKECLMKMLKSIQGDNPSERVDNEVL